MSNNPLHLPFMQGILTSRKPKTVAEPPRQNETNRQMAGVKRYISLRIYQAEKLHANAHPSPVQYLEAGRRYRIVLQCDEDRMDQHQQEITINGGFKLYLECHVANGICPFALPQDPLDFDGPFASFVEIPFELPQDDCPSCNVTIKTKFVARGKFDGPELARCSLEVKGNTTPEDSQWLAARYIEVGVPKNTIVLSVDPTNPTSDKPSQECLLATWNYYNEMFHEYIDTNTLINVAEYIKHKRSPVEILRRLKSFSRSIVGKLMGWIRTVKTEVEKRGKQLSLVIFDSTLFEIPWELLEIDDHLYLGAVAQVARWLPLEAYGNRYPLKIDNYLCEGSVVSYLDRYVEGTLAERALLQQFEHRELPSLASLKARLEKPLQEVGLLYIACHGSYGTHLYASSSAQDAAHPSGSSLQASWLLDLPIQNNRRPTLFINACESARILYQKESYAYNLVRNFLLPCASNYIGTIVNVDSKDAPEIANQLLELARKDEGVQITELLRRLRADAIGQWQQSSRNSESQEETVEGQHQKERAAAQLLNRFSYVYYGNPLARLRLLPAKSEKEET